MNDEEQALASFVFGSIQHYANNTERSMQQGNFKIGVSNLGHCQEFVRRTILQEPFTDQKDYTAAFLGTAIGDYVERAMLACWPGAVRQQEISVTLEGDQGVYEIGGHPDIIVIPGSPAVIDVKTVDGLGKIQKKGPSQQQLFQRHLYSLGCWQKGLFGDIDPETIKTANVWVDRSGREHECWAHMDTFSYEQTRAATMWLDDVVYAVRNNEEAQREPSREFCAQWCERFSACRASDTDVEGLLTDPDVLAAIDLHYEAAKLRKQASSMDTEAKNALDNINGSTGKDTVRWTWVNGGSVAYERQGYLKLSITPTSAKQKPPPKVTPIDLDTNSATG